jgi:hypothetical protein
VIRHIYNDHLHYAFKETLAGVGSNRSLVDWGSGVWILAILPNQQLEVEFSSFLVFSQLEKWLLTSPYHKIQ